MQTIYKLNTTRKGGQRKSKLPWFSHLLQHSASKQGGLILQRCRAHVICTNKSKWTNAWFRKSFLPCSHV